MSTTAVIKKLAAKYILSAMVTWVPMTNQYQRDSAGHWLHDRATGLYLPEDQDEVKARYEATADDIVDVAYDENLEPLFAGDNGRIKTALLLAAVPSLEGGFHKWVADGTCNTREFQRNQPTDRTPECDGGRAYSVWQIWMYGYIIKDGKLTQAAYLDASQNPEDREWIKAHRGEIITGTQIVQNQRLAALIAYYLMRDSFKKHPNNLCAYTGESCSGRHPLATQRWSRAVNYMQAKPFTMPSEDELQILEATVALETASLFYVH